MRLVNISTLIAFPICYILQSEILYRFSTKKALILHRLRVYVMEEMKAEEKEVKNPQREKKQLKNQNKKFQWEKEIKFQREK